MTATTQTACRVVDMIVHGDQVEPGDLMLVRGVMASVESVADDASQPAFVHIMARHASFGHVNPLSVWQLRHKLVAVRRYQEG